MNKSKFIGLNREPKKGIDVVVTCDDDSDGIEKLVIGSKDENEAE